MRRIKIIADEKISFLNQIFAHIGYLTKLPSAMLNRNNIKDYDILLVRTVTRVNEELLKDTNIKIVCSLTSGIDHIDRNYLKKNGIKLIYAPGSNANSVAEYVIACLLILAKKKRFSLSKKTIGIIGVGNVGTKVAQMCTILGMKVLLSDPPKFNRTKNRKYLSFRKLSDADIITLHTPLTFTGKYPTYHMVNEDFLKKIKRNVIIINTSRGSVVDENVLLKFHKKLWGLVLDVWENEPDINISLLNLADIGTPHIAGYSLDGKLNAAMIVYKKLCSFLKEKVEIKREKVLPILNKAIFVSTKAKKIDRMLYNTILSIYDPANDHTKMRKILKLAYEERPRYFEFLRKKYPVRREFFNYRVMCDNCQPKIKEMFKKMGFEY